MKSQGTDDATLGILSIASPSAIIRVYSRFTTETPGAIDGHNARKVQLSEQVSGC